MLAHLTDTLTTFITNMYVTLGLAGIVVAMALESCCIPLPSEIVMPLAGVMFVEGKLLAGVNFWLGLLLMALAGAIGCLIGSIAAYGIGYAGGRPLMLKYGRYVLISQHDADMADRFFQKWGGATAFFSRLMPIVRTYISLPAGITKMPLIKFCIYTFLGSFPWCFLLAYVGTVVGNNLSVLTPIFRSFRSSDHHCIGDTCGVVYLAAPSQRSQSSCRASCCPATTDTSTEPNDAAAVGTTSTAIPTGPTNATAAAVGTASTTNSSGAANAISTTVGTVSTSSAMGRTTKTFTARLGASSISAAASLATPGRNE